MTIRVALYDQLGGDPVEHALVEHYEDLFRRLDLGTQFDQTGLWWSSDDCVVLDIDCSRAQWVAAHAESPRDYAWTAWATRGYYGTDRVCVHVVVPMARPVTDPGEYSQWWGRLNSHWSLCADPASSKPGRLWRRPSRPERFPPVAWHCVGVPTLDPGSIFDDFELDDTMDPDIDTDTDTRKPLTWAQVLADPRFSEVKRRQRGTTQDTARHDHFTCHFDGREFVAPDLDTILFGINRHLAP